MLFSTYQTTMVRYQSVTMLMQRKYLYLYIFLYIKIEKNVQETLNFNAYMETHIAQTHDA